ncbi:hypothetical protein Q4E93_05360 [Flavitalea sp. BT771]|uniref:hypothetical protein n=1 Tax=Flavitalea sp. BT771 TaxID=3063329 RepID=UPI0026E1E37C|nr:hypothetical protein [Flavitalea sp. BT771]MDO6430000.1 hypothetical protein [Flavitalea sp. BT771]MDV6217872.1 hypothetical protein [Flavitalea sp. BT771]
MALSKEVLDSIAFSKQNGFDKLNLAPPEETRKAMAKAAQDPGPTAVADVITHCGNYEMVLGRLSE